MPYLFTFIIHNALVTLHLHRRIILTSAAYFPTPYYIYISPQQNDWRVQEKQHIFTAEITNAATGLRDMKSTLSWWISVEKDMPLSAR
jgi:hypothetical protein